MACPEACRSAAPGAGVSGVRTAQEGLAAMSQVWQQRQPYRKDQRMSPPHPPKLKTKTSLGPER